MRYLLLCLLAASITACSQPRQDTSPVKTQQPINLKKYAGRWYEIASFPAYFQKNCLCTQAYYQPEPHYIRVINSCYKKSPHTPLNIARGKAFITPNTGNSKLKVQFFWPFKGDYWILYVSPGYQTAVVGNPKRNYLWLLSRTPTLPHKTIEKLKRIASKQGFDISRLQTTWQGCRARAALPKN